LVIVKIESWIDCFIGVGGILGHIVVMVLRLERLILELYEELICVKEILFCAEGGEKV
jgi:hypothetical protein